MNEEEWRPFFDGAYEVSSRGRVRRARPGRKTDTGRLMKLVKASNGYYSVGPTKGGRNVTMMVHALVAEAFLGPPNGRHVNHRDGDKLNNDLSNLEYVTRKGNMEHAAAMGLMVRGEQHPQSKLTDDGVRALRADRAGGLSFSKLAKKYGISIGTAYQAAMGRHWRHVQ